jgi:Ca2+-binding EF-hand superfamily protein
MHRATSVAGFVARLSLIAAASTGAALAAEATAPQSLPTGGHAANLFIPAWDTNGDGAVPRAEYDATRTQRFASADENGDGALDADEYVNEYAVRLDRQIAEERKASIDQTHTRFRALDKDGDGFVSRAEYDGSGERAFAHLDHDKDGRIAKTDPDVARPAPAPAAASEAERQKQASERQQRPRTRSVIGMPSTHDREGLLTIYDTDDDGVVTREQYDAARQAAFKATDANGDGRIASDEYVDEFADRLDRQIARSRQAQLRQGHVRFESIDADKNGRISREEYVAMSARMFERADTNKDGTVSQEDPAPPARERAVAAAEQKP